MDKFLSPFHQNKLLNILFLSNVFLSFHYALVIYINSSVLLNFFSQTQVSALYIIASICDTLFLLNASKIIERIGGYKFIMYAISVELLAIVGLAIVPGGVAVALFFIVHTVAISVMLFNMDIFMESVSNNESKTGEIRAAYLTITNTTVVLAPAVIAVLLIHNIYSYVYLSASICIIPMYYFMRRWKNVASQHIRHINLKVTLSEYIKNTDLYNILVSQFLLQLFYAYMVIYTPIYLYTYVGFSWTEIGIMFTIMLLPFVFIELPLGEMEDSKYSEKEFLTIGFIIMGLSTIFISFITLKSFWIWTVVLFITRIGASFVEISSESYFFKRVNQEKTDVISFFRVSRPISFIAAPILATLALQFISFQYIFIIIGAIMVVGTHYSLSLTDGR